MAEAEFGPGRLAEPAEIADAVEALLAPARPGSGFGFPCWAHPPGPLVGKRVLVTSGPTHEPIDPVRYLANRSSGRQGHAIAAAAAAAGAEVTLVSGPVSLPDPAGMRVVHVERPPARCWRRWRRAPSRRSRDLRRSGGRLAPRRGPRRQDQEGRHGAEPPRPGGEPRHPRDDLAAQRGAPRPSWSGSPPRPIRCSITPAPRSPARAAISSSPTTSRLPVASWVGPTTRSTDRPRWRRRNLADPRQGRGRPAPRGPFRQPAWTPTERTPKSVGTPPAALAR